MINRCFKFKKNYIATKKEVKTFLTSFFQIEMRKYRNSEEIPMNFGAIYSKTG